MSYYKYHVFICTNQRADGAQCCAQCNAQAMRDYMKKRSKQLGIAAAGQCRINSAGCLDRCESGPLMVIYPQAVWYTFVDQEDIEEILQSHLLKGEIVERLLVK
ncbi:MAG: NAD(P)H-dependent oxidoreductase subunit E [gamma proteobacterium symbiont of Bathyaustriella thionipta]|nr:NAD(P)H-dependent oxidoreductase subunit E [gamma proteobacterium symbiont of Bathyaustriella thionipta]